MKILLVEDSRATAMVTTARLESFGHEVEHAVSGQVALDYFQKSTFDLILMDIEMPGMNGFETTTRIRALEGGEPWAWTPIIFVTATDTPTNVVTAIEAGGDDFISKMAPESVLQAKMKAMSRIAALRTRLADANRKLQEQANLDGLTGLFNHTHTLQLLEDARSRARRSGTPLSFAMLDIDFFKKVNDTYGHPMGDRVIKSLALFLKQRLRKTDHIGRYGGEEFAVVLPDTDAATALKVLDEIRQRFAEISYPAQPMDLSCTFSCGIAELHDGVDSKALSKRADEALYEAKHSGRNRSAVYPA